MELEGIDHVAMGVRDIERTAKWYIDVLGFERLHNGMWNGVPTFIGKGNTGLALFPANQEPKTSAQREIRMLHLAFRANRENFLGAQRELKKRGIKFEFQDHEIAHSIYFRIPTATSSRLRRTTSASARAGLSACHVERSRDISRNSCIRDAREIIQRFLDFARNDNPWL